MNQGLLPSPGTRGPGTKYDRSLLERLQLIKLLQRGHWPLAKIRSYLETLDEEGVRQALGQPPELPLHGVTGSALTYVHNVLDRASSAGSARPERAARAMPSPPSDLFQQAAPRAAAAPLPRYDASARGSRQITRSTWERIRLARDIELHIRRPLTRGQNKLIDRLLDEARKIFSGED